MWVDRVRILINLKYRGEGLGKNKSGIVECIQIRRKEENLGVNYSDLSSFS